MWSAIPEWDSWESLVWGSCVRAAGEAVLIFLSTGEGPVCMSCLYIINSAVGVFREVSALSRWRCSVTVSYDVNLENLISYIISLVFNIMDSFLASF